MTDDTIAIQVRVRGPLRERVENWRRAQPRIPPLSEALRQLIEKALGDDARRRPTSEDQIAA